MVIFVPFLFSKCQLWLSDTNTRFSLAKFKLNSLYIKLKLVLIYLVWLGWSFFIAASMVLCFRSVAKSVNNGPVFRLRLIPAGTASRLAPFSTLPVPPWVGWGWAGDGEGTQPGQLTQTSQRDLPHQSNNISPRDTPEQITLNALRNLPLGELKTQDINMRYLYEMGDENEVFCRRLFLKAFQIKT